MLIVRKLSQKKIYVKDWMRFRPYEQFSKYDKSYTEVANEVLDILMEYESWFKKPTYGIKELKELAVIITSYFEDFINEIGLWKAFVSFNKKELGYYLPFYPMDEYDPEYLNPEDFSFLIWHYMSWKEDVWYGPDAPNYLDLGQDLYNFLEPQVEDVPTTNFYKKFFTLSTDDNFFVVKKKIRWLAMDSYITGPEFSKQLEEKIEEFLEENPDYKAPDLFGQILYAFQDDYIYDKRSALSALSALDWFREVAICSSQMKENLSNLHKRLMSGFLYKGASGNYHVFEHVQTQRKFEVVKQSFSSMAGIKPGFYCILTLIQWNGEWWMTGTVMSGGELPPAELERIKKDWSGVPFYIYTEEQQNRIWEDVKNMEAHFLDFFGERVVVFKDHKELEAAMKASNEVYNAKYATGELSEERKKELKEKYGISGDEVDMNFGFEEGEGVGTAFVPGEGMIIESSTPRVIQLLNSDELDREHKRELFDRLVFDLHPLSAEFLLKNYPTKNVVFPISVSKVDAIREFKFIKRYHNPNEFAPPVPKQRLVV